MNPPPFGRDTFRQLLIGYRARLAWLTVHAWLSDHVSWRHTAICKTPCSTRCSPSPQTRRSSSPGASPLTSHPAEALRTISKRATSSARSSSACSPTARPAGPPASIGWTRNWCLPLLRVAGRAKLGRDWSRARLLRPGHAGSGVQLPMKPLSRASRGPSRRVGGRRCAGWFRRGYRAPCPFRQLSTQV